MLDESLVGTGSFLDPPFLLVSLVLNNLKQKGAAADLAGPRNVDTENVLVGPPRYHSNADLQEYLQGYVQRCGHLATLEQFGNSTLGNPLVRQPKASALAI